MEFSRPLRTASHPPARTRAPRARAPPAAPPPHTDNVATSLTDTRTPNPKRVYRLTRKRSRQTYIVHATAVTSHTRYRVRPYLSTGVGVRLSVGEPLEAKRPPTRTGIMRRLWGWPWAVMGQAWVASDGDTLGRTPYE